MKTKKVALIILDGWGLGQDPNSDAIQQANTPFIDSLYQKYTHSELITFGEDVGLPDGQMGNSEVGHLNIGAGRVVYQELARINKAIREKELHQSPVLLEAIEYAKKNGKPIHLMGLLSDGGVHSHINHLLALCDIIKKEGIENAYIHAFMDGRDTDPKNGIGYIKTLEDYLIGSQIHLASVIGRYYAMDRDNRWERIKLAYDLMVKGVGDPVAGFEAAVKDQYDREVTDEFLKPMFKADIDGKPIATLKDGDVLLCFNFRTDRPRQISKVLTQEDLPDYNMKKLSLHYVTMARYDNTFENIHVLFEKQGLGNTLGEVLSKHNKSQVRIAETEKYPHVTYFFSGGVEKELPGEKRILIPSPKVPTYDLQPEMSAWGITNAIVEEIEANQPDFICLNYANADMVGHTGVFSAAITAAETVDQCCEKLVHTLLKHEYQAIIIADHGNSDYMINPDGSPNTAHTKNPVPCIFVSNSDTKISNGKLADIAPTILNLMDIPIPAEMTGNLLLLQ